MNEITLTHPKGILSWLHIYRLYKSAFPREERKPFFIIFRMFRSGKTDLWVIRQNGKFVCFAATVNSDETILLDYLAIHPRQRQKGIGSKALAALNSLYPEKGLFVEIESTFVPGPDQAMRLKRKQFYLGAGMVPLNVEAYVFGVNMELLGWRCQMDFEGYQSFYRDHYSPWAAEHILPV